MEHEIFLFSSGPPKYLSSKVTSSGLRRNQPFVNCDLDEAGLIMVFSVFFEFFESYHPFFS